jgi:hypothetical protein
VIIVHHCGVDGTRPRGHTSLTGAVDAQLAVKRTGGNIITEVEWMKDGPEGDTIVSRLEVVDVGINDEGDTITSCVVVPSETTAEDAATPEPKLTKNQQTLFSLLHAAGSRGLSTEEWNDQARDAGLGLKRKADLFDLRASLKAKNLIRCYGDRWTVAHSSRQSDAQGAPF